MNFGKPLENDETLGCYNEKCTGLEKRRLGMVTCVDSADFKSRKGSKKGHSAEGTALLTSRADEKKVNYTVDRVPEGVVWGGFVGIALYPTRVAEGLRVSKIGKFCKKIANFKICKF